MNIATTKPIRQNKNGGYYIRGSSFTELQWYKIVHIYSNAIKNGQKCSIRQLSKLASCSRHTAKRAIEFYRKGEIVLPLQGTPRRGVGSLTGLEFHHHRFLYTLYLQNPAIHAEQMIIEFYNEYSVTLSHSLITRWFKDIGPFKGTFRRTSLFPPAKNTPRVLNLLREYLRFMNELDDHTRLVFADEKPMKSLDLFSKVRRDPLTGSVPHQSSESANKKIRYNIFAAVTIKANVPRSVDALVLEESGDAFLFRAFVMHLIEEGTLIEGDLLVVDNCSIHFRGENTPLMDELWNHFRILMLPLPPYHPELNPTEFVFAYLVIELRSKHSRSQIKTEEEFVREMQRTIGEIGRDIVWSQYKHCGYLKN